MFQCGDISFLRDSVYPSNARGRGEKTESEVDDISSPQRHTKLGGNIIGDGGLGRISPSTADVKNVAAVAWRIYFAKDSDRLKNDVKACSVFLREPRPSLPLYKYELVPKT
jgi:hypothetical protein